VGKFLKAFLLSKGWQLRRIHDLEALLDDAMAFDPSLAVFRELLLRA
jgi:HEPN domain-containing protein